MFYKLHMDLVEYIFSRGTRLHTWLCLFYLLSPSMQLAAELHKSAHFLLVVRSQAPPISDKIARPVRRNVPAEFSDGD